jgi:hypothetical protein
MGYLQGYDDDQGEILQAIRNERNRQEDLKSKGKFSFTCFDSEMNHFEFITVLLEEVGEASHEVNEGIGKGTINEAKLWDELVQVATVCVARLEEIQKRHKRRAPDGAKCK